MIKSFYASSNNVDIASSIEFTVNGIDFKFIQFEYELSSPIEVNNDDGWISISSKSDNDNDYFAWLVSDEGNNFLYHKNGGGGRSDDVAFTLYNIKINNAPDKPSRPNGKTSGKAGEEYPYTTSTDDPDGDRVWYKWSCIFYSHFIFFSNLSEYDLFQAQQKKFLACNQIIQHFSRSQTDI